LIHYLAVVDQHVVEVWRDERHVRRVTDGVIDLVAELAPDGEVTVAITDTRRSIRYRGTRDELARVGIFVDWSELTRSPRAAIPLLWTDGAFTLAPGVVELPIGDAE
jgi:hypothetical protein